MATKERMEDTMGKQLAMIGLVNLVDLVLGGCVHGQQYAD
jgi:hypothetical protein